MKPITNLRITGITTCEQMKKLAKLTGTKVHESVSDGSWKNMFYLIVCDSKRTYLDWVIWETSPITNLTWDEFLKQYDNSLKTKTPWLVKLINFCYFKTNSI